MRTLTWSPRSRRDLIRIAEWYDQLDPALADDIVDRIEAAPLPLLKFPEIGSLRPDGTRKWRAPRTPFLLFYDVTSSTVEIVTVVHAQSNWRR